MRNPSKKTNKLFAFRDFQKTGMITSLRTDYGKYQYYKHLLKLNYLRIRA